MNDWIQNVQNEKEWMKKKNEVNGKTEIVCSKLVGGALSADIHTHTPYKFTSTENGKLTVENWKNKIVFVGISFFFLLILNFCCLLRLTFIYFTLSLQTIHILTPQQHYFGILCISVHSFTCCCIRFCFSNSFSLHVSALFRYYS